jgi:hypothetical protein
METAVSAVIITLACVTPGQCQFGDKLIVPIYTTDGQCIETPIIQAEISFVWPGYRIENIDCGF